MLHEAGQPTQEQGPWGTVKARYDAVGNMVNAQGKTCHFGALDALLEVEGQPLTWSELGHLTAWSDDRGSHRLEYGPDNTLQRVHEGDAPWEGLYDGLGRRVQWSNGRSFGMCNWFPEHGKHLIADLDLVAFAALHPAGKVFQYVGSEDAWRVVQYGANTYRVSPDILKPIPTPAFEVGQPVVARERVGVVADVTWHFKDMAPIYFLEFQGKRSSRRYSEAELLPA